MIRAAAWEVLFASGSSSLSGSSLQQLCRNHFSLQFQNIQLWHRVYAVLAGMDSSPFA